mmetsp:Transcript_18579/g.55557  ORF Transcript_18579/g.55557 Transcript_18579/m.55557 type:complete len:207 (-) Transcript_18579:43-663(-)
MVRGPCSPPRVDALVDILVVILVVGLVDCFRFLPARFCACSSAIDVLPACSKRLLTNQSIGRFFWSGFDLPMVHSIGCCTVCKEMDRSRVQRMANVSRSTRTKHATHGNTSSINSSATFPLAIVRTASGIIPSVDILVRFTAAAVRYLTTAATVDGVSHARSSLSNAMIRRLRYRVLRDKTRRMIVDGGIPCARATNTSFGTCPVT